MRRTLAPLSAAAFFLRKSTWRLSGIFTHQGVVVNFSDEEFIAILEAAADFSDYRSGQYFAKRDSEPASGTGSALRLRDASMLPPWAVGLRRMLSALAGFEFNSRQGPSLVTLCEAGARYGLQELEAALAPKLLPLVSQNAKRRLKRDLQRILERGTRPCLELERTSYNLALAAIGLQEKTTDPKFVERKFLGEKPSERLFSMFRKFPVLSRLWFQLISQWRDHVMEILERFETDRNALSRTFFDGQSIGTIIDMRCGLSDSHNGGRTVTELQFEAGSVIYKPRPGDGEWEWASLVQEMDARSFRPKLRAGRVLRRSGYCWMERIEPSSCKDMPAACRFYRRMGGIIGAAYLLRAADCHRDNIIASGEHPVLVDAEALWHLSLETKAQTPVDLLYRTGFLPGSNRRSLQTRSSVLGSAATGQHVPRIRARPLSAAQYEREIVDGFCRAWRCLLGTRNRRAAFVRRLRRIRSRKRRWIYWPTEKYAAIARASIQPAAVRSGIERELLIARLCSRRTAPSTVIHAEIDALKRLDIPYCVRRIKERSLPDQGIVSTEVIEVLHRALDS
jgi:lantibiotic modifying enzyme